MEIREVVLPEEREAVRAFLKRHHLRYEADIDRTLVVRGEEGILATASAANDIIKCVAVREAYRGKNVLNRLMSRLIKELEADGIAHLFAYASPEHEAIFASLGFTPIVSTMNVSFLEFGGSIKRELQTFREEYGLDGKAKAAVVINANPLTKGHLHLIEKAGADYSQVLVFVVSEDRSFFPFKDRFAIIHEAIGERKGITVLPTGRYLVSYATFPKYFASEEHDIDESHALIDVLTFKKHYMPAFNIVARYVGDEPYSPMTRVYNETMARYLGSSLRTIDRKTLDSRPISASTVRKLLRKNGLEAIRPYVPEATLAYLKSEKGKQVIEQIKRTDRRH